MSNVRSLKNPLDSLDEVTSQIIEFLSKVNVDDCKELLKEADDDYKKSLSMIGRLFYQADDLIPLIEELAQQNILIQLYGRFQNREWSNGSLNMFIVKVMIKKLKEYFSLEQLPSETIPRIKILLVNKIQENISGEKKLKEKNQNLKIFKKSIIDEEKQVALDLANSQILSSEISHQILQASSLSQSDRGDEMTVKKLQQELNQINIKIEELLSRLGQLHVQQEKINADLFEDKTNISKEEIKSVTSTQAIISSMKRPDEQTVKFSLVVNDADNICGQRKKEDTANAKEFLKSRMLISQADKEQQIRKPLEDQEGKKKTRIALNEINVAKPKSTNQDFLDSFAFISQNLFLRVADSVEPKKITNSKIINPFSQDEMPQENSRGRSLGSSR